jgi:hypothetical protein
MAPKRKHVDAAYSVRLPKKKTPVSARLSAPQPSGPTSAPTSRSARGTRAVVIYKLFDTDDLDNELMDSDNDEFAVPDSEQSTAFIVPSDHSLYLMEPKTLLLFWTLQTPTTTTLRSQRANSQQLPPRHLDWVCRQVNLHQMLLQVIQTTSHLASDRKPTTDALAQPQSQDLGPLLLSMRLRSTIIPFSKSRNRSRCQHDESEQRHERDGRVIASTLRHPIHLQRFSGKRTQATSTQRRRGCSGIYRLCWSCLWRTDGWWKLRSI